MAQLPAPTGLNTSEFIESLAKNSNWRDLPGGALAPKTRKLKFISVGPEPLESELAKSLKGHIDSGSETVERLAFEVDPTQPGSFGLLYRAQRFLIPDHVKKRVMIQDSLVAAITNTRAHHVASHGQTQDDRFSNGFRLDPRKGVLDKLDDAAKTELEKRIEDAQNKLMTCGSENNVPTTEQMDFTTFLYQIGRDGSGIGRFAVEAIFEESDGKQKFHRFRPTDASTIFYSNHAQAGKESIRETARHLIETIKDVKIEPERYFQGDYAWAQVINGTPRQFFTAAEMLVCNVYPVTDVELLGYPVSPLDTVANDVMMHINSTSHNQLYFQHGRATRGMVVVESDDFGDDEVEAVKQHFNANINSVGNSFRMPIFGVGREEDIRFVPLDGGSKDMEFQYLSDHNSRVMLAAWQMSPDELPGYAHLSRGTNSQALSEANNEYKLTAARDVGLRPFLNKIQSFINKHILPLIDPVVAKLCVFKFVGLDADTPEKEAQRLGDDASLHLTQNQIFEVVGKPALPREVCGDMPLSPGFQALIKENLTFGQIQEFFLGRKGASQDPSLAFYQNPFWFQNQQMLLQQQQLQAQQQQMQMQAQQQAQAQRGGPDNQGGGGGETSGGSEASEGPPEGQLTANIDQALGNFNPQQPPEMGKAEAEREPKASGEAAHPLLTHHTRTVEAVLGKWRSKAAAEKARIIELLNG